MLGDQGRYLPDLNLPPCEGSTADKAVAKPSSPAKGLEFRAVVATACYDKAIPLPERIETVADDADLDEGYITERHPLYVACTRAHDYLLVIGVEPASGFLDDVRQVSG
jgi:superfamily I DNA/RNA helicase